MVENYRENIEKGISYERQYNLKKETAQEPKKKHNRFEIIKQKKAEYYTGVEVLIKFAATTSRLKKNVKTFDFVKKKEDT